MIKQEQLYQLNDIAAELRLAIILMIYLAQSGHPGGSLSAVDIITALYFHKMRHNPKAPNWPGRDRFVLSKGHAAPALYAALAKSGYFSIEELWKLRQIGSLLQGHPTVSIPGVEATTGSLGQGLSIACGMAYAQKMKTDPVTRRVYALLGDGECQEGQVWEAAMFATQKQLGNLIAFVDYNGYQIDGPTDEIMSLKPLAQKWEAFGWKVFGANGHDLKDLIKVLDLATKNQKEYANKPKMIIAQTTKGAGTKIIAAQPLKFHGEAPSDDQMLEIFDELMGPKRQVILKDSELGREIINLAEKIRAGFKDKVTIKTRSIIPAKTEDLLAGKATRVGFGAAMVELAQKNPKVMGLTADLCKSVSLDQFKMMAEKSGDHRFIDCGIAEANMISIAGGLSKADRIPFAASFAAFAVGRALDQIRVAAYSGDNLKIGGSHGGLTVGEDGATHIYNEDIAHMRVMPNFTVIVPADAFEAYRATLALAEYQGPAYLRLGRANTPSITNFSDPFVIGQANEILFGTEVAIIACGIMVAKALEAAKELEIIGHSVAVINLSTIKPIYPDTLEAIKQAAQTGAIVTAEEHSIIGGLGSAVAEVVTTKMDQPVPIEMVGVKDCFGESGKGDKLLEKYGLTEADIVAAVLRVIKRK